MGSGNTKPGDQFGEADDLDGADNQPTPGATKKRNDYDLDYSQNKEEQEEMKQALKKPTTTQKSQKAPVRQQEEEEEEEEDPEEDDLEEQEPKPVQNQKQAQRQGRENLPNRPGNSPANNNQAARNPSMVTPKAQQGQSTQLRSEGSPKAPKGRPQGKGNKPEPQTVQKKPAVRGIRTDGQGKGLIVEEQKLMRKEDPNTVFTQFVKAIKSDIPYPVTMASLKENRPYDVYFFTSNTNIFYGLDEEKLIVVPLTELTKIYDAIDAAEAGDCLDETFPPTIESLCEDPAKQSRFKAIIWRKFSELCPKEGAPIIQNTNKPNAIDPGDLRDLAFQSVLSILAENIAVLPSNFPDINEISHKVYAVWLNDCGEWECFIVDEHFPFDKGVADWAFTKTKMHLESWILIIEKAFAKMYGGYEKLERGHPAHFLHDITGAPYDYFYFEDEVKCWDFIESVNGDLTVVVALSKNPTTMIENENIVSKTPAYAYKVQGQVEIMTPTGKERLILMKSCWGFAGWKGDWSRDSKRWTQELMSELNPEGYKEDSFWMSIQDFISLFGVGFIFTLFADYLQCSLRLNQARGKNYSLVLINVPGKGGHGFVQISQKDSRCFEDTQYEYSVVKMMLAKVDSKLKLKSFVGGIFDKGRDCELEVILEAGDYLAYIEIDWKQNEFREYVLSSYHEVNLVMYELESKDDQLTVLQRFLKSYFHTSPDASPMQSYPSVENNKLQKNNDYVYGYLCFYYINTSNDFALEETVRMNSLYGLEICPPYRNSFEFSVEVPNNSDAMVVYRTLTDAASTYHYQHTVWSVVWPNCDDESLRSLIIAKATNYQRRKSSKAGEIDVLIFNYEFEGGFCIYYLNKTPFIYEEQLTFELYNLEDFDGNLTTEHDIYIHPNEGYLITYRVVDSTTPYNYYTRLKYRLVDPLSVKTKLQQQGGTRPGPMSGKKPIKAQMPGQGAEQAPQ